MICPQTTTVTTTPTMGRVLMAMMARVDDTLQETARLRDVYHQYCADEISFSRTLRAFGRDPAKYASIRADDEAGVMRLLSIERCKGHGDQAPWRTGGR